MFPLALTPPGGATPHWLMGTGIRQRTIFRVKVYAFGLYVDADAARTALAEFAGAPAEALGRDQHFTRRLLDLDFGMALRLVMTRTVGGADVAEAFDDALRPRMPRAGAGADDAAEALARLRGHLDVEEVRRDAEMVFSCGPAGRLAMTVDGAERPPFESRALCRALFDVYLGEDPIEPDGRRNLIAGFAGLLQPPRPALNRPRATRERPRRRPLQPLEWGIVRVEYPPRPCISGSAPPLPPPSRTAPGRTAFALPAVDAAGSGTPRWPAGLRDRRDRRRRRRGRSRRPANPMVSSRERSLPRCAAAVGRGGQPARNRVAAMTAPPVATIQRTVRVSLPAMAAITSAIGRRAGPASRDCHARRPAEPHR